MRRFENRPSQRAPRIAPLSAAVASGTERGWLVDSKYKPVMTLMMYLLLFYITVPSNVLTRQDSDVGGWGGGVDPVYRTLKLALLASGVLVLIWRHSFAVLLAREVNKFFIAFVALVLLSTTWSIEPAITATRFFAIFTICLVCGGCVMIGWYDRRFQEIVRSFLTALMVGSLIYGIIAPDFAKEVGTSISLTGAWRGMMEQKNEFGHAASIAVFLWVHGLLTKEVKFRYFVIGFGSAATCLILSRSSTSIFSALFSSMLLLLLLRGPKGKRRYMAFIVAVFATMILLYSLAVLNIVPGLDFLLQPVIALTGKDATFSGRTQIWAVIREHISQAPLLGTGYGAYWIGPVARSPSSVFITRKSAFYPTESHNGYLEIINDLGYVGLLCLLGFLLVYLRQSLSLLKIDYKQATLYLALLFGELINNLTESDWFGSGGVATPIVTLATFGLARALLEQRWRSQSQEIPLPASPIGRRPRSLSRGHSR
jgi:exopolysaccharide production protein ExoQ